MSPEHDEYFDESAFYTIFKKNNFSLLPWTNEVRKCVQNGFNMSLDFISCIQKHIKFSHFNT